VKSRTHLLKSAIASGMSLALMAATWALAADTFEVDTVHSSAIFRIKHANVSYSYGRFNDFKGKLVLDDKDPSKSEFDFRVSTESVDTGNPNRDGHLKGPDFFNAKQFPTIAFKSTKVAKQPGDKYQVTGDLTLHGVTKPITVTLVKTGSAAIPKMGTRTGFETTFDIKRTDFGMSNMVGMVGDDVRMIVSIEAGKR
jgi:polyisoprenoid-binding protein YceI